jgi:hypothetical protein
MEEINNGQFIPTASGWGILAEKINRFKYYGM